jgi:hypothetical protein
LSNKSFNKSEIVYNRLRKEYGKEMNWDDFSDIFGISRQAMGKRRSKDKMSYKEIKELFSDVNKEWLHSDDPVKLKSLPVKNKFANDGNQVSGIHAQNMNTELGDRVMEKIIKYIAEAKKGSAESLDDPVLSALKDQLKSHRAMLDAQVKNLDSMLRILDMIQKK